MFRRIGLVEDTDYVMNTIAVRQGVVGTAYNDSIPLSANLVQSLLSSNASFTSDGCDMSVGEIVTLRANVEIKPELAGSVSNATLLIDLPKNCSFVGGSVKVNNQSSACSIENGQLAIPLNAPQGVSKVLLCVRAEQTGSLVQTAYLRYTTYGVEALCPIGATNITVSRFRITVPQYVATPNIPVTGTVAPGVTVSIFDDDEMIGQTRANANGQWSFTYQFDEDVDYADFTIWAKYRNGSGEEVTSETKQCHYNASVSRVSSVTMHHYNSYTRQSYTLVFDFLDPNTNKQNYPYYCDRKFNFTIDFTDNSPEAVSQVRLWVKKSNATWVSLDAEYDSLQNNWKAVGDFSSSGLPVNVSVEYVPTVKALLSKKSVDAIASFWRDATTGIDDVVAEVDQSVSRLFAAMEDTTIDEAVVERMIDSLCFELGIDTTEALSFDTDSASVAAAMASLDSLLHDPYWLGIDSLMAMTPAERAAFQNLMQGITIEDCGGIDTSLLAAQGYTRQLMTDSTVVYIRTTDSIFDFIDIANDTRYRVQLGDSLTNLLPLLLSPNKAGLSISQIRSGINTMRDMYDAVDGWLSNIRNALDGFRIATKYVAINCNNQLRKTFGKLLYVIRPQGSVPGQITLEQYKNIQRNATRAIRASTWMDNVLDKINGSKILGIFNLIGHINSAIVDMDDVVTLYFNLPEECDGPDAETINGLKRELLTIGGESLAYYLLNISLDIISLKSAAASAAALLPTCGVSSVALGWSCVALLANMTTQQLYTYGFESRLFNIRMAIPMPMRCSPEDDDPDDPGTSGGNAQSGPQPTGKGEPSLTPDAKYSLDPSGYVYEGVPSNRLEGVLATCYYKEFEEQPNGDINEYAIVWDASEFDQDNPLYTDENGMYQWFVPQGLWKVVFEKDGYETTQTDWLPVPPPQLEVNVGMVQNSHPEVTMAHAYPTAVELQFDKYMLSSLLNTGNIMVTQNGSPVPGTIEFLDAVSADTLNAPSLVSRVRFNADTAFSANEVTLLVSSRVRSYANIAMQGDFMQTFAVEPEITEIRCDSMVHVVYGGERLVNVAILPASAAAGKTLRIRPVSPDFLGLSIDSVVLGTTGRASFMVHGEQPGVTALQFSVDGYERTAYTVVSVSRHRCDPVHTSSDTVVCDQFVLDDTAYYSSCTLQRTYTSFMGCDSTATIHLTVHNSVHTNVSASVCDGQSFSFGQHSLTAPGVYYDTLPAANRCDSIVVLALRVNSPGTSVEQIVACDSLQWHGTTYTSSNHTATFTTQNNDGCDSVVTLDLTLHHSTASVDEIVTCDSILWLDGMTYTSSNHTATYVTHNVSGCDSVIALHLTIKPHYIVSFNANEGTGVMQDLSLCAGTTSLLPTNTYAKEGFFFAGWSLTADGTVCYTDGDTITLNGDMVLYAVWSTSCVTAYATALETVCDSILWREGRHYTSGTYYDTIPNAAAGGCDSVYALHLTVNVSDAVDDVRSACDSMVWHGVTYTSSTAAPAFVSTNAAGCDSITTLRLTINHSQHDTVSVEATEHYEWNGVTYTESGTYLWTSQTQQGCDSIVTLVLVVHNVGVCDAAAPKQLRIYPNPTDGIVIVDADEVSMIEVFDMVGHRVLWNKDNNRIDISVLPSGAYTLRVSLPHGVAVCRVIRR